MKQEKDQVEKLRVKAEVCYDPLCSVCIWNGGWFCNKKIVCG